MRVAWATIFLRRKGAMADLCRVHERSSAQMLKSSCVGDNLLKTKFQITAEKSQVMRRWSLVSVYCEQRQQEVESQIPQVARFCLVGSLLRWAIHMLNACLGTEPLNQTDFDQSFTISLTNLDKLFNKLYKILYSNLKNHLSYNR